MQCYCMRVCVHVILCGTDSQLNALAARRWEASVRHTFQRVDPTESALTVRLTDSRAGAFRREMRLLGEATIHCLHIKVGVGLLRQQCQPAPGGMLVKFVWAGGKA